MTTALLQTTYFGPIQWYQKLFRFDSCIIEQHDTYHKQTYRNRCVIATANGLQALTVPIESDKHFVDNSLSPVTQHPTLVKDLRISNHNQWRKVHWNALQAAYNESPFFDYYADDLRPFFEKRYEFLIDFNEAIRQKICELLDISPNVERSQSFSSMKSPTAPQVHDFREVIHAKHPIPDPDFTAKPYWQVFQQKHGFLPNLSILDLLCCMGPESIFYL